MVAVVGITQVVIAGGAGRARQVARKVGEQFSAGIGIKGMQSAIVAAGVDGAGTPGSCGHEIRIPITTAIIKSAVIWPVEFGITDVDRFGVHNITHDAIAVAGTKIIGRSGRFLCATAQQVGQAGSSFVGSRGFAGAAGIHLVVSQ